MTSCDRVWQSGVCVCGQSNEVEGNEKNGEKERGIEFIHSFAASHINQSEFVPSFDENNNRKYMHIKKGGLRACKSRRQRESKQQKGRKEKKRGRKGQGKSQQIISFCLFLFFLLTVRCEHASETAV